MSSSEEIINNNKDTNDVNKNNNINDINDINNNSISDNDNITSSTSNSTTATTLLSKNEEHNITVYTRIRPLSSLSKKALQNNKHSETITPIENNTSLLIKENINTSLSPKKHQQQQQKIYEFDKIFDQDCTQENLYTSKIKNIINDNVWSGYNVTIFAYGQSGSGKTYTMGTHDFSNDDNANTNANSSIRRKIRTKLIIGQEEKKDEQLQEDEIEHEHEHQSILNKDDGIIPRVAYDLFHNNNDNKNISIQMSYLEVYNEEIRDLLSSSPSNNSKSPIKQHQQNELRIRDDGTVTNLTILNVKNTFHVKNIMKEACKKRVTALTSINNVSSRSHAICTFYIKVVDDISNKNDTTICSSKLSLVDLAGSERVKRTNAIGDRFSEGVHINKGLLVLGQVISTLSEQSQSQAQQSKKNNRISNSHIPYRDSKLTRLLQDSLGGNSRTIMIACVSSCKHDIKESVNTLRYAQRARNIKNSTSVGKYSTSNSSSNNAHVIAIQRENENLKMKIQRLNRQMNINNTMNSSYNNKSVASSSSLQQHLNNSNNASKITKKENIITKKENTLLQKQNDSLHKEILEIKKRNVNLQKKIREESSKRNNEVKEYKLKSTKLLRENQKLKVDVSKMSSKVNNQSLILRRRASDTINKNKINNKNNSSGSSRRLLQNNASANSSSNNRRVSNAYNRNNNTNNIDVFSSRQEMVNIFERDIELATLILDTKDEIDLLEKAISKEKKLKQQQQSSLSSSLAKAVSSSTLNSSITNDTTDATTITNAQNEIELRSNTIESLQKRILDLSSKNTIITNNSKNKNNNNSNTKKDVVLLTMAKQLSYAELKYVLSYSFDIHVHTKRNIQNIINSEVTTKLKSERELMIKEKINLHNKYEKDILEFMEHGLGIDNGVKSIVDDMLGSHDFYKYCSGGSSTSSVREDRSNDNNNDNDG